MKRDVIVSIQGKQFLSFLDNYKDDDDDNVEFVTFGELVSYEEDDFVLTYRESSSDSRSNLYTTLSIQDGRVTVIKEGSAAGHIIFEEGRHYFSTYDTSEGALTIGVTTRYVCADINEGGGDIELFYFVDVDHAVSGANYVKINIKPSFSGKSVLEGPAKGVTPFIAGEFKYVN